jgi:hypothetical protein
MEHPRRTIAIPSSWMNMRSSNTWLKSLFVALGGGLLAVTIFGLMGSFSAPKNLTPTAPPPNSSVTDRPTTTRGTLPLTKTKQVILQTLPEGAEVLEGGLPGVLLGKTPVALIIEEPRMVRLRLKGYKPLERALLPSDSPSITVRLEAEAPGSASSPPQKPLSPKRPDLRSSFKKKPEEGPMPTRPPSSEKKEKDPSLDHLTIDPFH